jgi:glutamyl endopeptidase
MKLTALLLATLTITSAYAQEKIVIDQDTRVRVTAQNYRRLHDSIGLLYIDTGKSQGLCTGTVIGINHVVTAAHCVVDKGQLVKKVIFVPGLNEDLSKKKFPFGTFTASKLHVLKAYMTNPMTVNDLAVIAFNENLPVAPLQIAVSPEANNLPLIITGYPGDKPNGTMWEGKGTRDRFNSMTPLAHNVDTAAGQSGSAVRTPMKGTEVIIGIHSAGNKMNGKSFNTAYFFSAESVRQIRQWMTIR